MSELTADAVPQLEKHFGVSIPEGAALTREYVEKLLTEHLVYMLHEEMEKLLQALYRIDVNERKVKDAFAQNNPKAIAPELARLIIDRELQKAESRRTHKGE
jgi:hypothetical protein